MKIKILYFASLSESLGLVEEHVEFDSSSATVDTLKSLLAERGEQWAQLLRNKNTRCAVNQTLASDQDPIVDGAEIAFFPPVTGG